MSEFKYSKLQRAWLDDLKTTEAKQGKSMLQNLETGAFCCLGRACEVMELPCRPGFSSGMAYIDEDGKTETTKLTRAMAARLGVNFIEQVLLIHYNDSRDYTFKQIVEVIEADPSKYLVEVENESILPSTL